LTDPVELLRRLQVSLVTGWMPPDVARWLSQGVDSYLDGRRLESALGLKTGPGKPSPPAQIRLEQRDEIVRRLARGVDGGTWTQAGLLAQAVADFQALKASGLNWRDHKNRTLIPASLSGARLKYMAEADRLDLEIPSSQSQINKILTGRRD